jgi:hypothetical protein
VAQVPLHGARADEEAAGDLRVRETIAGKQGNSALLNGQVVASLDSPLSHRFAGGQEFAAGALGECLHADGGKHVVGRAEFLPRVDSSALTAQPFSV